MGQAFLVERNLAEGKSLLEALDRAGLKVRAALWAYFDDSKEWRLIIATPILDRDGPMAAYKAVQAVLLEAPKRFRIRLDEISIVGPDSELIERLRAMFKKTPEEPEAVDLSYLNVLGMDLGDAIVYRIEH